MPLHHTPRLRRLHHTPNNRHDCNARQRVREREDARGHSISDTDGVAGQMAHACGTGYHSGCAGGERGGGTTARAVCAEVLSVDSRYLLDGYSIADPVPDPEKLLAFVTHEGDYIVARK